MQRIVDKNNTIIFEEFQFGECMNEIERSFNITFGHNDFETAETLGDVLSVIYSKITFTQNGGCASQKAFYLLRRTIRKQLNTEIAPDTNIDDFILTDKRRTWVLLEKQMQVKFPVLKPNGFQYKIIILLRLGMLFGIVLMFFHFFIGLTTLFSAWCLYKICGFYFNRLPVKNTRDLVKNIVENNYATIQKGDFNKNEVEKIVNQQIGKFAVVPSTGFDYNSKIVEE